METIWPRSCSVFAQLKPVKPAPITKMFILVPQVLFQEQKLDKLVCSVHNVCILVHLQLRVDLQELVHLLGIMRYKHHNRSRDHHRQRKRGREL